MSLNQDVRLYVRDHPGADRAEIAEAIGADLQPCRGAIKNLIHHGYLVCEGFGSTARYYPGREPDPHCSHTVRSVLDSTPRTVRELIEETGRARGTVTTVLYRMERGGTAVCDRSSRPHRWTAKEERP